MALGTPSRSPGDDSSGRVEWLAAVGRAWGRAAGRSNGSVGAGAGGGGGGAAYRLGAGLPAGST